jgi:Mg-chelatase subunit ChlD
MSSDLTHQPRPVTQNASLAERIKQQKQATGTFLLLDCSGSMSDEIAPNERAIDKLRKVARDLRKDAPSLRQVIFPAHDDSDQALEIQSDIPEPRGLTPLAEAITYSAQRGAVHLIIVSDGMPNSGEAALRSAEHARCKIDVCYVGAPNGIGEAFLRQLAALHGGQCNTINLATKALETKIRGLLSA